MATAAIGHNNPPEPTPLETFKLHIDDLFETAAGFLDGTGVANDEQAEFVSKLLSDARDAGKDADKQRVIEKKPHDDAGKAVQAAWKPLIERAELTAETCKKALAPWLKAKDDALRAVAEAAAKEAEEKAAAARALHQAAEATDLAAQEAAETALRQAEEAAKAAAKADGAKAHATGGSRAVGLVSVWSAEIEDRRLALNHYIQAHPGEFVAVIQALADHEARHGPRTAPGIKFTEERVAR
jgi:hypothetical protein